MNNPNKQSLIAVFLNDRIVIIVIIVNALVLFFHGFNELKPYHQLLEGIDHTFTIFFIIETIIKIRYRYVKDEENAEIRRNVTWASGWRYYAQDGWHRFDFVIVALSAPSLGLIFFDPQYDFEFLLILRVLRVFKFLRFIEFIPNAKKLAESAMKATKASIFILVSFFIYTFIASLFSCYIFKTLAPEYFENPLISFYTLFRVFTVDGWADIVDKVTARTSPQTAFFTKAYFIALTLTGGVIGLSIINAIFIDEMNRDNEDNLHAIHQKISRIETTLETIEQKNDKQIILMTEQLKLIRDRLNAKKTNENDNS